MRRVLSQKSPIIYQRSLVFYRMISLCGDTSVFKNTGLLWCGLYRIRLYNKYRNITTHNRYQMISAYGDISVFDDVECLSNETCTLPKEPCNLSKEPCILSNDICVWWYCGDLSVCVFRNWRQRWRWISVEWTMYPIKRSLYSSKRDQSLSYEPYILSKDLYILSKEINL